MEILEGEDFRDGQLISHTLYKFEVEDNVTDQTEKSMWWDTIGKWV